MHTGRAGANHNAGQLVVRNCLLDHFLSRLGTHILIIGGENNTGFILDRLCNRLHIHRTGNVRTAVTDKNSNSLHGRFSFPT